MSTYESLRRASNRCRLEPGRASDYIRHAPDEITPENRLILCCRVSQHLQRRRGNLADQEANLRHRAKELGAVVAGVVAHEGSGTDPSWLARAATLAERHRAKLFAESTDRLIRHPAYHSKTAPNLQAREVELKDLAGWTKGMVLVTDLHPDALPWQVRSYQRKRGQRCKENRGGRPKIINT